MPAEAMWLEVGKHRSAIALGELLALKHVFGVSIQALTHRCRDLDIINKATYRALFNEFDRLGWRTEPFEEYGAMPGELPNRFNRLCLRALAEGAISESKAAELLGVGIADVDDYMRGTQPSTADPSRIVGRQLSFHPELGYRSRSRWVTSGAGTRRRASLLLVPLTSGHCR